MVSGSKEKKILVYKVYVLNAVAMMFASFGPTTNCPEAVRVAPAIALIVKVSVADVAVVRPATAIVITFVAPDTVI